MIRKLFKLLGTGIILLVVGLLGYRIFSLNHYPAFAEGIVAVDPLKESHLRGELSGKTWELPVEMDTAGEFFAHQPIYFENEKVLIVTIRYNDSLLEELKFDGDGSELPLFPSLYADGVKRVIPTCYEYGHAFGLYSYRRYVFENVDLAAYEHLYLDIHREEAYEDVPYTTLEIYNTSRKTEIYELTSSDKKELLK
ncbi:MAG: hypothetical protein IJA60_08615 [Clostridia bacterium]|nr:hypothetical protein [Clostridia bacterium]